MKAGEEVYEVYKVKAIRVGLRRSDIRVIWASYDSLRDAYETRDALNEGEWNGKKTRQHE